MQPEIIAGSVLADCRVESLIGEGATGSVYLAEDLERGGKVALKVLSAELARDERYRQRFVHESRLAATLDHPHIVPILASGEEDGVLYLAMAYVEGSDLRELLRREGRLEPERALDLVDQVAEALDAAHEAGLVHRDVKPGNILVSAEADGKGERASVRDFGLALQVSSVSSLTTDRGLVDTIDYISPEQIEGGTIDARADVYSLGCVLYECLAGVSPFDRESARSVVLAHLNEPPPLLTDIRPELPQTFDGVFQTALAKWPEDRYSSCGELVEAARAALEGTTFVRRSAPAPPEQPRRETTTARTAYVWATLVTFFGLLGAVLALNVIVDPFALAGTDFVPSAVENDRSIKLTLIDRLDKAPGILILGSSRARQAEPSYLQRLTGRSGFNAAVTGGTAADAWVMTRYTEKRFPAPGRGYVWFVDVGIATNGVNPQLAADPRAKPYLSGQHRFKLQDVGAYLGTDASGASLRVLKACATRGCRPKHKLRYLPDGSLTARSIRNLPEQEKSLKRSVDALVASIRANPPTPQPINPARFVYFEKALEFMNQHGSTPVIVLNPIHPRVLAELRKYGFPGRKPSLAYLGKLHARFDFVLVDAEDIRAWHGTATDWENAKHINRKNMRRLLTYIVARSHGALGG